MAIQYPGGVIRNQTLTQTAGTKVELVDWIKAELVLAGWTAASGASGDWKLDSAIDAQSKQFRVRIWDGVAAPTSTNCAQLRIMNVAETIAPAQSAFLLPAVGKTWRIVCNKYQAFIWVPGSATAREFCAFGQAYTGMTACSGITAQAWLVQNASTDTDTSADSSLRTAMTCATGAFILNAAGVTGIGGTAGGVPKLMPIGQDANGNASSCVRWHNDDYFLGDALLFTGTTTMNEEGKCRGQLWGAMVDSADRAMDTTFAFDSHNWIVITSSNTNANGRGTLCIATD